VSFSEPTGQADIHEAASGLLRGALRHTQAARLAAALVPLAAVPITLTDALSGAPQPAFAQDACSATSGGALPCRVPIPLDAQCTLFSGSASGTALAVIAGGKVGLPEHRSLLVTSCNDDSAGLQSRLYFINPVTGLRVTLPGNKTHLTTTVTPSSGWNALAYRVDKGDLLACDSDGVSRIDISPFNTVADGTATRMGLLPDGSACDGITWDHTTQQIYQSGFAASTVHRYSLPESGTAAPAAAPVVTAGSCPSTSTTGIAAAGPSLFVGCDGGEGAGDVKWLDKNASGTDFGVLALPSFASPGDLECDPITFQVAANNALGVSNRDALWTRDQFSDDILALPLPAGVCSLTTPTPVAAPAACPANYTGNPNADSDGDGLLDCWEDGTLWTANGTQATAPNPEGLPGIDFDGNGTRDLVLCVDASAPLNGFGAAGSTERLRECAHPNRKDVFVEIDYMREPAAGQTTHRPNPLAVSDVQAAYAAAPVVNVGGPTGWATGIRLHVQVDDSDVIPHKDKTVLVPCTVAGTGASTEAVFDQVKAEKFGTVTERGTANAVNAKKFAFRWVLFGHNQAADPSSPTGAGGSGCAEIIGNDALVSMGTFSKEGGTHNIGSRNQQAGTLMHELGHNLGLRHGGGVNTNCLVNYISVMNYIFQFDTVVNTGKASTAPTRWRLDYSRQQLALGVTEANLVETLGVGAFPEPNELLGASNNFIVHGPANTVTRPTVVGVSPTGTAINWNRSTTNPTPISVDLNNLGISGCGATPGQTHVGFDDWANLVFNFRASPDFADGAHFTIDETKDGGSLELAFEDVVQVSASSVIDIVPGDVQNRFPRGVPILPVAILSSELLDARDVDPSTATLSQFVEPPGPPGWTAPVQRVFGKPACLLLDVNKDGKRDLVCGFDVSRVSLPVGEHQAQLDATTTDGRTVKSGDVFRVIQLNVHH
jgi:hypothetical protein